MAGKDGKLYQSLLVWRGYSARVEKRTKEDIRTVGAIISPIIARDAKDYYILECKYYETCFEQWLERQIRTFRFELNFNSVSSF